MGNRACSLCNSKSIAASFKVVYTRGQQEYHSTLAKPIPLDGTFPGVHDNEETKETIYICKSCLKKNRLIYPIVFSIIWTILAICLFFFIDLKDISELTRNPEPGPSGIIINAVRIPGMLLTVIIHKWWYIGWPLGIAMMFFLGFRSLNMAVNAIVYELRAKHKWETYKISDVKKEPPVPEVLTP